ATVFLPTAFLLPIRLPFCAACQTAPRAAIGRHAISGSIVENGRPVDPIAHTLTGGALAAAGLRRATPLAAAALLIGANVPDVDVVAHFGGEYAALAHRRGWTHGILAVLVWPFVVCG